MKKMISTHPEHHPGEQPLLRDIPLTWGNLPRLPLLAIIRLYQLTISRGLPEGTCRFYPTCSHYSYEAIAKYGVFRGGFLSTKRILRCQPLHPGGHDPVP